MRIGILLAIFLGTLLLRPAFGAAPADDRSRERIAAERREADRRFDAARLQCEQRFAVTACLEDARSERRRVLDRLASEEAALDEVQRRARAAERLRAIQSKTDKAPRGVAPAASAPEPRVRARKPQRAASAALPSPVSPDAAEPSRAPGASPQAAERHRQAQQAREREAQVHREAVTRRNAERDARKPPAAPLPLPSAPASGR